jgi:hypothetical protein
MMWLIVSFEHNAFWAPNWNGYTREISKAGRYSEDEARQICQRANIVRPPDSPHEVMVPAPESIKT